MCGEGRHEGTERGSYVRGMRGGRNSVAMVVMTIVGKSKACL